MRQIGVGLGAAAIALLGFGAPQAAACGWLWACAERPYAYRASPHADRYRSPPRRAYRHGGRWWAYGYTSPARAYGDAYAAWPSTSIPPSRWYARTALPGARTDAVGLRAPTTSAEGILRSGMPARGPTLFGPPAPVSGYAYGNYYGAPAYGYSSAPAYATPPRDTPSWWVEPRRRR